MHSAILVIFSIELLSLVNFYCVDYLLICWTDAISLINDQNYLLDLKKLIFFSIDPPKWLSQPKDTVLNSGDNISLECVAGGHPLPNVTWMKSSESK